MAEAQLGSGYLRLQAGRCRRLSQNCMDLGTAGDLRQMSEEYFATASKMKADQAGSVTCLMVATRNGSPPRGLTIPTVSSPTDRPPRIGQHFVDIAAPPINVRCWHKAGAAHVCF